MPELFQLADFAAEASEWIASRIVAKQAERFGVFRLSLCGGETPRPVYEALAARHDIDWERVLLTFGDERCVPPDDPASNYRMVRESLLDPARVPRASVMRMAGEMKPAEAADRAEGQLRKLAQLAGEEIFTHDLVLLGLGGDGHTASLFPGTEALDAADRWVVANRVPQLDAWRLTLTFPVIDAARQVAFLVTGEKKRPVIDEILAGGGGRFPASRVRAARIAWLLG